MRPDIYFLDNLLNPEYTESFSEEERTAVGAFLIDMSTSPSSGEVDISWQENSRGYYCHLEVLSTMKDNHPVAASDYMNKLDSDSKAWLLIRPNSYSVLSVRKLLKL